MLNMIFKVIGILIEIISNFKTKIREDEKNSSYNIDSKLYYTRNNFIRSSQVCSCSVIASSENKDHS